MSPDDQTFIKSLPKIYIEAVEDHEDGSSTVNFIWDENDPELLEWNNLSDEERSELILKAISVYVDQLPESDP